MKRITTWVLVTSFTFTLGVVAALLWLEFRHSSIQNQTNSPCSPSPNNENFSADLPILAYCELANNPEKYDGKIVRVSARLAMFIHGRVFADLNCSSMDRQTAVTFDPQNREEIERTLNQASGSDNWIVTPMDLIAVGRFRKVVPSNQSDTIYDTASLQFEIMRVEKASKAR